MQQEKGAKITIDDLAAMMNRSFEHIENIMDKRFLEIDKSFLQVDKRFAKMEMRFDDMDDRFDDIERSIGSHEHRITRLEDDVRILKTAAGK